MKRILSAALAAFSIFCFTAHSDGSVIHSDNLEGTLASMHARYWQWSPVIGYHLYMNTKVLENAFVQAHTQSDKATKCSDALLRSLFVYDPEDGSYEAQNNPQLLAAYFTSQIICVIVRFIYYYPCYAKEGYTPENLKKLLAKTISKLLPLEVQSALKIQCREFASHLYDSLTETKNRIPLNYMLMVFLCMRAETRDDIYYYIKDLPAHFFKSAPIAVDPRAQFDVNTFTSAQHPRMTQDTLEAHTMVEKLFLQELEKSTDKNIKEAVKRVRNQFTQSYAATNAANTSLMTIDRELFLAQTAEEVESAVRIGANINSKNLFGSTPLHCAVMAGNLKTTDALLAHEASPYKQDRYRYTPLLHAVNGRNPEMVKLLLKYESDHEKRTRHAKIAGKLVIKDQEIAWILERCACGESFE